MKTSSNKNVLQLIMKVNKNKNTKKYEEAKKNYISSKSFQVKNRVNRVIILSGFTESAKSVQID
jgi:hypothetical protein